MSLTHDQSDPSPDPKEAAEARLCAYLEGELSDADRADVDRHLTANPTHRQLLAELAEQRSWLRGLPAEPAPAEVADVYRQQVERSMLMGEDRRPVGTRGRVWRYVPLAALLAMTLGLVATLIVMLAPPSNRPAARVAINAPPPAPAPTTSPAPVVGRTDDVLAAAAPAEPPAAATRENAGSTANNALSNTANAAPPLTKEATQQKDAAAASQQFAGSVQQERMDSQTGQQQQTIGNAGAMADASAPSPTLPTALTVTTANPAAVDGRIRAFVAAGHLTLADDPSAAAPLGAAPGRPSVKQARRPSTPAVNAAPPPPAARAATTAPAMSPLVGPTTPATAAPLRYVVTGLTADQVRRLWADLSPGSVVSVVAAPPLQRGQTITVTVAQLAGRPGLSAANVVRVADDGTITLPMIDPVPVAGQSALAVAARVAAGYRRANVIPDASVTVTPGVDDRLRFAGTVAGRGGAGGATARINALPDRGLTLTIEVCPAPH